MATVTGPPEDDVSTTQPGELTVSFPLPVGAVAKLREQAARRGLPLEAYLRLVTERTAEGQDPTGAESSDRLEKEITWLTSRPAEDVEETRRRLFGLTPDPTPIPEGKTLSDMVQGQWPGDEADKQVRDALDRLS
jgi:hypothetical protein